MMGARRGNGGRAALRRRNGSESGAGTPAAGVGCENAEWNGVGDSGGLAEWRVKGHCCVKAFSPQRPPPPLRARFRAVPSRRRERGRRSRSPRLLTSAPRSVGRAGC